MTPPIATAHLLPEVHLRLIELLRSLDDREWRLPTVAPAWTVTDVAAHLLDTQQRVLARLAGEPEPAAPAIASAADLVAWINHLNAEGVRRYGQLAPSEIIARLDEGAGRFAGHYRTRDPFAPSRFGVSWAGEESSSNWFDAAREYTERWHHQQQIRLAAGRPGIMTPELYHPVLDTFMRALPFRYRDVVRPAGTRARFTVSGECGGSWDLESGSGRLQPARVRLKADATENAAEGWRLTDTPSGAPASITTIPQELAWRIFTKGIGRAAAEEQVRVSGDADLGLHVLGMIAIVG